MITKNKNIYHILLSISSLMLVLIPATLISGPFLSDLFVILISIIFLIINKGEKKIKILEVPFSKLFIIFFIYIVIRALFSDHILLSLKPSATYIRFGIFAIAIYFIFKNQKNTKKIFYLTLFATLAILILDGYFQFFTGKNIFGYSHARPDRLGGLFFDELILGSFISKMLPILLTFFFLNKEIINHKFVFIFILINYFLIFFSGERSAFILATIYFLLILPFIFNIKKLIILVGAVSILLSLSILNNDNLKSRYIDQMLMHTIHKSENSKVFMPDHIGLFSSALDIFKRNIFFGTGIKTFREECKKIDLNKKETLEKLVPNIQFCSTHPHNYYLQLLSETGIFGFLFVLYFFLQLIINYYKQLISLFKNKRVNKSYICILVSLIISVWPLTTSGNFFNNWICINLFLGIGIFLFVTSYENDK